MTIYEQLKEKCNNNSEELERLQNCVGDSLNHIIKAGAGKGFAAVAGQSGEELEKLKANKEGTDLIIEPVADEFKAMYNEKLVELFNS